jgi:hypothetical protein
MQKFHVSPQTHIFPIKKTSLMVKPLLKPHLDASKIPHGHASALVKLSFEPCVVSSL